MPDFTPRSAPSFSRFVLFFAADDSSYGATNSSMNGAANGAANTPMTNSLQMPFDHEIATDDFVDFYALLDQPVDAPTIQLRSRINEMYAEAQANRDHRNPERRRQYANFLYWIPQARAVLLHEGKRAKYDAYAAQIRNGGSSADFHAYLEELIGEMDALNEGEGLLGLRDPLLEPPPTARLSTRLDAVRAAAGEAVKASILSPDSAFLTEDAPQTVSSFDAATPTNAEPSSDAFEPREGTANTPQDGGATEYSGSERPVSSRRRSRSTARYEISPTLQKERASLFSSAVGGVTLFVVLLASRVALPNVSLAILCGFAVVAGFLAWRIVRRQLLRGIDTGSAQ